MPPKVAKRSARERLANRRSPTRIPDTHAANAVTVTDGTRDVGSAPKRLLTVRVGCHVPAPERVVGRQRLA